MLTIVDKYARESLEIQLKRSTCPPLHHRASQSQVLTYEQDPEMNPDHALENPHAIKMGLRGLLPYWPIG